MTNLNPNTSVIFLKNVSDSIARKSIIEFLKLLYREFELEVSIEFFSQVQSQSVIRVASPMSTMNFLWLVQVVSYPKSVKHPLNVVAWSEGDEEVSELNGKKLMVRYLSIDDSDYMEVCTSEGDTYQVYWNEGVAVTPINMTYTAPMLKTTGDPEVFETKNHISKEQKGEDSNFDWNSLREKMRFFAFWILWPTYTILLLLTPFAGDELGIFRLMPTALGLFL